MRRRLRERVRVRERRVRSTPGGRRLAAYGHVDPLFTFNVQSASHSRFLRRKRFRLPPAALMCSTRTGPGRPHPAMFAAPAGRGRPHSESLSAGSRRLIGPKLDPPCSGLKRLRLQECSIGTQQVRRVQVARAVSPPRVAGCGTRERTGRPGHPPSGEKWSAVTARTSANAERTATVPIHRPSLVTTSYIRVAVGSASSHSPRRTQRWSRRCGGSARWRNNCRTWAVGPKQLARHGG